MSWQLCVTRVRFGKLGRTRRRSQSPFPRLPTLPSSLVSHHDRLAVTVHGSRGDWSIFRREGVFFGSTVGRKHGPVPFPRRKGDSPIFAAVKPIHVATFPAPRKLGQSPVNGYRLALQGAQELVQDVDVLLKLGGGLMF